MKKTIAVCLAAALLCGLFGASCAKPDMPPASSDSAGSYQPPDSSAGTEPEVSEMPTESGVTVSGGEFQPVTPGKTTGRTVDTKKTSDTTRAQNTQANKTTTAGKTPTTTAKPQEDAMTTAIQAFLNVKPSITPMPAYNPDSDPKSKANEWANIEAITFDGAAINNRKTKVFAYIGFPEGASASKKVPAIVLVHGGGGHAYAEWVKLWTDRGYAAIAMDTTGFFPSETGKGVAGRESDNAAWWHFGLYGDFAQTGYVNAPNNDEMKYPTKPLDQQWMYHAIVDTMLARNILAADSRVDTAKIGITGISWGGVITSLAIGYDANYAFAIPVYGSGYLDEAHSWMGPIFSNAGVKKNWSAAERFDRIKMPVLWLGWTNDTAFSINSNSKSYDDTKAAGAILSMKMHWGHSHGQGWQPEEAFHFADSIVKDGPTMTVCVTEPRGRDISFTIKPASDATEVSAQIFYITDKLSYTSKTPGSWPTIDQTWKTAKCTVEGNTVKGTLPSLANSYYVELTTTTPDGKYITTTRFVEGIR